jgi:hypothetical protein
MVHLRKEAATDPLRSDPRFEALVPSPVKSAPPAGD